MRDSFIKYLFFARFIDTIACSLVTTPLLEPTSTHEDTPVVAATSIPNNTPTLMNDLPTTIEQDE